MPYRAPGLLAGANAAVLAAWNEQIRDEIAGLLASENLARAGDHLAPPEDLPEPPVSVHWTADPAEPRFCLDETWAQKLSDWGAKGRSLFQNEYCEYSLVTRVDDQGRVRLKRFTATTELAEWWTTVATFDPPHLAEMAQEVLGRQVGYDELYGSGVGDPVALSPRVRRVRFARQVAGNGRHPDLEAAGVPQDPVGDLNRRNALFMRQPINGLDDLLYIVIFGAQPYVVEEAGGARRAELHEIFRAQGTTHLACRNADPAAAQGAFDQVLKSVAPDLSSARGCKISFADPVGMYFVSFQTGTLLHNNAPVPESWTRFSRGEEGLRQRLEFGPADNEPAFLDEVVIQEGAATNPIVGGYQLAKLIEVGPKVLIGPEETLQPNWFRIPAAAPADCSEADVCSDTVGPAKAEYERETRPPGLRGS